ncbi:MAG TPA: SIMPL domain-containing protein, partial [Daejeonella sp.]|nr:SIMPL domain-containing protein [Daejeonella sp.]
VVGGSISSEGGNNSLVEYIRSKGFPADKITFQTISNYPIYNYNQNGQQMDIRSYSASQMIDIQSGDVELIKAISLEISSLVEKGVNFQVNPPEYYYTKVGDIKIEIQAEAAKDAMTRGQRIAEATGRELGTLKSARMGVLQITPENSNMTSDYGINDVSSIRKEITAVVNANFSIE